MKFLVIGLGSMGKRRIRCLLELGYPKNHILGYDIDIDRRREVNELYDVITISKFSWFKDLVLLICTPPNHHRIYQDMAIEHRLPFFTEASVINEGLLDTKGVKGVPSCTMKFCPSVQSIKYWQEKRKDCKKFWYYCKSWLPDWHKNKEGNYYAFTKDLNGCKEMIPFELCWLTDIFGDVENIETIKLSTGLFGDFYDCYMMVIDFTSRVQGIVEIDVVSKGCGGGKRIFSLIRDDDIHDYKITPLEEMYVEELKCFIEYVKGNEEFPHTFEEDQKLLELTEEIEK